MHVALRSVVFGDKEQKDSRMTLYQTLDRENAACYFADRFETKHEETRRVIDIK